MSKVPRPNWGGIAGAVLLRWYMHWFVAIGAQWLFMADGANGGFEPRMTDAAPCTTDRLENRCFNCCRTKPASL